MYTSKYILVDGTAVPCYIYPDAQEPEVSVPTSEILLLDMIYRDAHTTPSYRTGLPAFVYKAPLLHISDNISEKVKIYGRY